MPRNQPFRATHGFSMVELLVSIVVLSIGLLGMAALQASTLRNNQSANYRTQASNLAYELIDTARGYQARQNTANVQSLLAPMQTWTAICAVNSAPTYNNCTQGALTCDRLRWANKLCRSMPNGRGQVTGYDAAAGTFTLEICWSDDRTQSTTPSAGCNDPSEGLGGMPYRVNVQL